MTGGRGQGSPSWDPIPLRLAQVLAKSMSDPWKASSWLLQNVLHLDHDPLSGVAEELLEHFQDKGLWDPAPKAQGEEQGAEEGSSAAARLDPKLRRVLDKLQALAGGHWAAGAAENRYRAAADTPLSAGRAISALGEAPAALVGDAAAGRPGQPLDPPQHLPREQRVAWPCSAAN